MTETDSDITRDYNEIGNGVGTNTNNDDITRGYEDITNEYMNSGFVGTMKVYIESK